MARDGTLFVPAESNSEYLAAPFPFNTVLETKSQLLRYRKALTSFVARWLKEQLREQLTDFEMPD